MRKHKMGEQAGHTPDQLLALRRILEKVGPGSDETAGRPLDVFLSGPDATEDIYLDPGKGFDPGKSLNPGKGEDSARVKHRRVTTNVESGTETFEDPIGAQFAYSSTKDSPSPRRIS